VDQHERLVVPGSNGPILAVTVAVHRRALLLLDSLSKALIARGHAVVFQRARGDDRNCWSLGLTVAGETIEASLVERLDRQEHVLTADEKQRAEKGDRYGVPKYDYYPAGRLQLSLHEASVARASWSDGDAQRLDQHLGRAVLAAEETAEARKRGREEAAERERQAEQRRKEAEQEQIRRRQEEAQVKYNELLAKDLTQMARDWSAAEDVCRFLSALDRAMPAAARNDGFNAWFEWASSYAAQIDPLSKLNKIAKHLTPATRA
jgi:hypothetical protein